MDQGGADLHIPVLLDEVLEYLEPQSGGTYVDGTLGLGGHSEAILKASAPEGKLICFDWDEDAIELAERRLKKFEPRYQIVRRNFAELKIGLQETGVKMIDGLLIDIGLSSLQLDMGGRGFSFLRDEPLDMRMDNRRQTTAAYLVNNSSEKELADIIYYFGEEKQARRIASELVQARKKEAIDTSKKLADLIAQAIPRRFHPKKIHVATKTFQALRIAVNTELENLSKILDDGVQFLRSGARFCVITFHSLEDRIVKKKFKENKSLEVLTSRPLVASENEVRQNPRARSAKLRVAVKIDEE